MSGKDDVAAAVKCLIDDLIDRKHSGLSQIYLLITHSISTHSYSLALRKELERMTRVNASLAAENADLKQQLSTRSEAYVLFLYCFVWIFKLFVEIALWPKPMHSLISSKTE